MENNMVKVKFENGEVIQVKDGTKIQNVIEQMKEKPEYVYGVIINNRIHSIHHKVEIDSECKLITYDTEYGKKMYESTLKFIFLMALNIVCPDIKVELKYQVGRGIYFKSSEELNSYEKNDIIEKMQELIDANLEIKRKHVRKEKLQNIYENMGYKSHLDLNNPYEDDYKINFCEYAPGNVYYNYLYDRLISFTGYIKAHHVKFFENEIILTMPDRCDVYKVTSENISKIAYDMFKENSKLSRTLGIEYLDDLNSKIVSKKAADIIKFSEKNHSIKYYECAKQIFENDSKFVFIAGPSSSGKTTSAKRIKDNLLLMGKNVLLIEMDNFFKDFVDSPEDKFGNKNFDSINHFDLVLFKEKMKEIITGTLVKLPRYDFTLNKGEKVFDLPEVIADNDTIVIIEGIHALNPVVSEFVRERKIKFTRIYLAPMTSMGYDEFTKISCNSVRLIRRIVRDYYTRGSNLEATLNSWENVKKGEEENIFPYLDFADICINTSLAYELCVLRDVALNILKTIDTKNEWYYLGKQLYNMLIRFNSINDTSLVPQDSILREFIGGGCYK